MIIWHFILACLSRLESLCVLVGIGAVVIPVIDQGIRRLLAHWPNSRALQIADYLFFGCGNALVNIGQALDKILAIRRTYRP